MVSVSAFWMAGRVEFVPYNSEEHCQLVRKFLCWREGDDLIVVACGMHWDHHSLSHAAKEAGIRMADDAKPIGAGICSFVESGVVRTWDSGILSISTPVDLRPAVLQALGLRG